jgi:hypothetical protein
MLVFKEKGGKKRDMVVPVNIDNTHQEIVKKFTENKEKMADIQQTIKQLNQRLDKLDKIPKSEITDEELNEKFTLQEKIDELSKNLHTNLITSNPQLYYVNTAHILYQYYNKCSEQQCVNHKSDLADDFNDKNPLSTSILDYFKNPDKTNNSTKENTEPPKKQPRTNLKSHMLDQYMGYVDSRYVSDTNKEDDIEFCKKCNLQKYFVNSEGVMVCQKCGEQDYVLIDCDKPSYKEPPREIAYFAYKRINHFNSWSGTAGIFGNLWFAYQKNKIWKTITYLLL